MGNRERVVLERFADQVTINTMGGGIHLGNAEPGTRYRSRPRRLEPSGQPDAGPGDQDGPAGRLNIVLRYDYLPLEEVLAVLRDKPEGQACHRDRPQRQG